MSDRLAEIEARNSTDDRARFPSWQDVQWLIEEVERLRGLLVEAIDYITATDPVGESWGDVAREAEQEHADLLSHLVGGLT